MSLSLTLGPLSFSPAAMPAVQANSCPSSSADTVALPMRKLRRAERSRAAWVCMARVERPAAAICRQQRHAVAGGSPGGLPCGLADLLISMCTPASVLRAGDAQQRCQHGHRQSFQGCALPVCPAVPIEQIGGCRDGLRPALLVRVH
eukprot:scaffold33768_cov112-Isochrysis_galbana.AAC.5